MYNRNTLSTFPPQFSTFAITNFVTPATMQIANL